MKYYRINKNTTTNPGGHNEVHEEGCIHYSQLNNYESLGNHFSCHIAIAEAKKRGYSKADGCKTCSKPCNNG